MRTTVRLDDHLLTVAKKRAAESGKTLTSVLEDALRESFARRGLRAKSKPVRLKIVKGGDVRVGVDLDDSASLLGLVGQAGRVGRKDVSRRHDACLVGAKRKRAR